MPEPREGGGQKRQVAQKAGPSFQFRLPHARPDDDFVAGCLDPAQRFKPHDVDEQGRAGEPHVQHRYQRLSAGDHARFAAALGERGQRFLDRFRTEEIEGCGFHRRPPKSLKSRWMKPAAALGGAPPPA